MLAPRAMAHERRHPFADLLGLEWDGAVCVLDAAERHLNPLGLVHGAVAYALIDTECVARIN